LYLPFGVIHIGVGFCVARSTVMGNPGPQKAGRVTEQTLTLFFYVYNLLLTMLSESLRRQDYSNRTMKKAFFLTLMVSGCLSANAQKIVKIDQTVSQARKADVATPAYVKPLIAELKIDEAKGRVKDNWEFASDYTMYLNSKTNALDPEIFEELRKLALFKSTEKYQCDVIVAPTYNVNVTEAKAVVTVIGYPANLTNWKVSTVDDYDWLRYELNQRFDKDDATKGERRR
jgi:hypothetical protein